MRAKHNLIVLTWIILLDDKRSGFGLVRFHKPSARFTIDCYRILADLDRPESAQMTGWPVTLSPRNDYARQPMAYLPQVSVDGIDRPVLIVTDETTNEVVYAIRLTEPKVRPWVYVQANRYRVQLGDPDAGRWRVWEGVTAESAEN